MLLHTAERPTVSVCVYVCVYVLFPASPAKCEVLIVQGDQQSLGSIMYCVCVCVCWWDAHLSTKQCMVAWINCSPVSCSVFTISQSSEWCFPIVSHDSDQNIIFIITWNGETLLGAANVCCVFVGWMAETIDSSFVDHHHDSSDVYSV